MDKGKKLTGAKLLELVNENQGVGKRELAKMAGYVNDSGAVALRAFYDALLEANGIDLEAKPKGPGRGRDLEFQASVHRNGQIVVGSRYTEELGLKPGAKLEIKVLPRSQKIVLKSVSEDVEDSEEAVAA